MRPRLLFAHGWALDATLWDAVLAALGEDAHGGVTPDAGYYGRPSPAPRLDGPVLGIGQSLGSLELLAGAFGPLAGVVAIDGFARFGQALDFHEGVPARVLARIGARLADDVGVLAEFVGRAGGRVPAGEPDVARLAAGLQRLETLDGRACPLPVWRLHADGDPIAVQDLADASFRGMDVRENHVRQSTDHLSPIHDAPACAALIRAALKALS